MESPIEAARALCLDIRATKGTKERVAWAVGHQTQAEACLENLIAFHEGFVTGAKADQERLVRVASALLTELFKLRDAKRRSRSGRTLADEFIDGTAPRLWTLAERLQELLEQ